MSVIYPLRLFFDCSTAHLSVASCDYLTDRAAARDEMIASTPYGWFVWAGDEIGEEVPADLAGVMRRARAQDADYILFDADAAEHGDLPIFDWSG